MGYMKTNLILFIFALSTLMACGNNNHYAKEAEVCADATENETVEEELMDGPASPKDVPSALSNRKLIKNGSVQIEVLEANVDSIANNLNKLIVKYNGYKSSDVQSAWNYNSVAKIPSASFDRFVEELYTIGGKLIDKRITVQDMTEYYSDLESAIKSKEAALEQYRVLLKRANKISEIIEIQSKIDRIQEDIDRNAQAKMNIDKKVSYGELAITLVVSDHQAKNNYEKEEPSFWSKLWEAVSSGWELIQLIIIGLFYIWPILLIGGLLLFFYRKRKKNQK